MSRLPTYEEFLALYTPLDREQLVPDINVLIYEADDPRLKRHVVHDERSRAYALEPQAAPTTLIKWDRVGPILDQGQLGSCTANAALGLLMTKPFSLGVTYTEDDAVKLYSEETYLDDREIPGHYPPTDSGSAGIYAMQALKNRGLISSYSHAFSLDAAIGALNNGPIAVGSVWLRSMYKLDNEGYLVVDKRSKVDGGHEYVVDGYDPNRDAVHMTNSWGGWGVNGGAWIKRADFAWLLSQDGDVVQPVVVTQPQPQPSPQPPAADDTAFYKFLRQACQTVDAWLKKKGY